MQISKKVVPLRPNLNARVLWKRHLIVWLASGTTGNSDAKILHFLNCANFWQKNRFLFKKKKFLSNKITFFLRYASFIVGFVPNMGLNVWNYTLSEKLLPKSSTNALLTLGIRRAMVLYHNAELVNPCKAGRSQGVDVSRYSKGL